MAVNDYDTRLAILVDYAMGLSARKIKEKHKVGVNTPAQFGKKYGIKAGSHKEYYEARDFVVKALAEAGDVRNEVVINKKQKKKNPAANSTEKKIKKYEKKTEEREEPEIERPRRNVLSPKLYQNKDLDTGEAYSAIRNAVEMIAIAIDEYTITQQDIDDIERDDISNLKDIGTNVKDELLRALDEGDQKEIDKAWKNYASYQLISEKTATKLKKFREASNARFAGSSTIYNFILSNSLTKKISKKQDSQERNELAEIAASADIEELRKEAAKMLGLNS